MEKYFKLKDNEFFVKEVYVCVKSAEHIVDNLLVGGGVLVEITKEEYLEGE